MPLYEFKCTQCRTVFEKSASMKEAPSEASCPSCNTMSLRHYSAVNFAFKGGKPTTYDIDYIVGREAEKGREVIQARLDEKNKLRKSSNENFILNVDGTYSPSTPDTKEINKQLMNKDIVYPEKVNRKFIKKEILSKS